MRGPVAEIVVCECRVEARTARELRQLDRRGGTATRGYIPPLGGVDDLAHRWEMVDTGERDPLGVPNDRHVHEASIPSSIGARCVSSFTAPTADWDRFRRGTSGPPPSSIGRGPSGTAESDLPAGPT